MFTIVNGNVETSGTIKPKLYNRYRHYCKKWFTK